MTRLRLPEPASDLLAKTHHILDAFLTPVTPGRSGWALTGGTVLGARWRHRESSDLDLVVHPETEIARLAKKHNPDFWRAMETAGATGIELEGTPTIHFPTGKIELITTPPVPRMGHTTEALETGRAVLLGPAQVLTGKLRHRSLAAPVRDLYDIAVGWRTDPAATAIAVNATSERTLRRGIGTLEKAVRPVPRRGPHRTHGGPREIPGHPGRSGRTGRAGGPRGQVSLPRRRQQPGRSDGDHPEPPPARATRVQNRGRSAERDSKKEG